MSWWAFYGDEDPIGPFDTKAEESPAGLEPGASCKTTAAPKRFKIAAALSASQ